MKVFKRLVTFILFITLSCNVLAEYTEEDIKNMKMIFCGECKDDEVKKDLVEYAKCSANLFPEVTNKIMSLRSSLKDDPDECFNQVKVVFAEFSKNNPDAQAKAHDCFHKNVNTDHLVKCH